MFPLPQTEGTFTARDGLGGAFTSGGGGGVDRALQPDPPKRGQLTGPPKTDPGTSVVPMTVVFVFQDTRPPVNSGYTCMYVPHHGLIIRTT